MSLHPALLPDLPGFDPRQVPCLDLADLVAAAEALLAAVTGARHDWRISRGQGQRWQGRLSWARARGGACFYAEVQSLVGWLYVKRCERPGWLADAPPPEFREVETALARFIGWEAPGRRVSSGVNARPASDGAID